MVDTTTPPVSKLEVRSSPVQGFVSQAIEVASDAIELSELQARLIQADASQASRLLFRPVVAMVVAGALSIAALPLILFGIAGLLSEYLKVSAWMTQLIVGVVALVISVVISAVATQYMKSGLAPFGRSTNEFKNNIEWLKTIFRTPLSQ